MPWTTADVERHNAGLSDEKKRQWVQVANSALARCLKEGRGQEVCEASAIRQANAVVKESKAPKSIGDDTLIAFGGELKALGEGKVGGYLVRFGGETQKDLEGEWFTSETYYGPRDGDGADCLVHHGLPITTLELADHWLEPIKTHRDDIGLWADAVLDMADEYESRVYELIAEGRFGWSSATAPHMRRVTPEGEITRWPIIEGSLTPMPAEPRNRAIPLKAYIAEIAPKPEAEPPQDASRQDVSAAAVKAESEPKTNIKRKEKRIMKRDIFQIANSYHVYGVGEDGKRVGDMLFSAPERKACEEYLVNLAKPDWQRALEMSNEAADKRQAEMLKVFQAGMAAPERGGYATAPAQTEDGKTFGDFLIAVYRNDKRTLKAMSSEFVEWEDADGTKQLGDQTGASGGFLVPTQFLTDLIRIDPEAEIVWPTGDKIPMASRTLQVPGVSTTGSTAGRTNVFGGAFFRWTETGTLKHETDIEFTQIELVAHEISAWIAVKEALLQDSAISLDPLIRGIFRDGLMYYTDEAFLDGTGVGQPQGIITAPGTLVLARNTANHILYEDVKTMYMHFMSQARGGAFWTINQFCMAEIMDMEDTEGHLLWQPNARESIPTRLLGLPIKWTEKTPGLGSQGDIILMNPKWYYIGQRQGVSVATSEHVRFLQNQVVYKCVMRLDGQEKLNAPVFAKDGTNQISPFVVLGAAAT